MRSRSRNTLVAFTAILALGAFASASASAALPEFATGPGETLPASFSGEGGSATWHLSNGAWSCTSSSIAGSISAVKAMTGVKIVFDECRFERDGSVVRCTSEGAKKEGEIKTEALEGTLVYLSKTAKTVGVDLKPQTGKSLGNFHCLGGSGELRGSIVMPITVVNKFETKFSLSATQGNKEYENEKGEKEVAKLEDDWPNGVFEPMSWETVMSLATSKKIEIKA